MAKDKISSEEASTRLGRRYEEQALRYPTMRQDIPREKYISANLSAARKSGLEGYKTVGNTPMPTAGSSQPHGYGHSASQKDGALRLSGNPKAHRIGKR